MRKWNIWISLVTILILNSCNSSSPIIESKVISIDTNSSVVEKKSISKTNNSISNAITTIEKPIIKEVVENNTTKEKVEEKPTIEVVDINITPIRDNINYSSKEENNITFDFKDIVKLFNNGDKIIAINLSIDWNISYIDNNQSYIFITPNIADKESKVLDIKIYPIIPNNTEEINYNKIDLNGTLEVFDKANQLPPTINYIETNLTTNNLYINTDFNPNNNLPNNTEAFNYINATINSEDIEITYNDGNFSIPTEFIVDWKNSISIQTEVKAEEDKEQTTSLIKDINLTYYNLPSPDINISTTKYGNEFNITNSTLWDLPENVGVYISFENNENNKTKKIFDINETSQIIQLDFNKDYNISKYYVNLDKNITNVFFPKPKDSNITTPPLDITTQKLSILSRSKANLNTEYSLGSSIIDDVNGDTNLTISSNISKVEINWEIIEIPEDLEITVKPWDKIEFFVYSSNRYSDTTKSSIIYNPNKEEKTAYITTKEAPNSAPTAKITWEDSTYENDTITLKWDESTDSDGSISSYEWKDENGDVVSTEATYDFSRAEAWDYKITLTVTDDDWATNSTEKTITVEKKNTAPTLDSVDVSWDTVEFDEEYEGKEYYSITSEEDIEVTLKANWSDDDWDTLKIVVNWVEYDWDSYTETLNLEQDEEKEFKIKEYDWKDYSNEKIIVITWR